MIRGRRPQLDGKKLFKLWQELGTLDKIHQKMIDDGIINPITGKPFSKIGIRWAIGNYELNFPDEARKEYQSRFRFLPGKKEDDLWNHKLVRRATSHFNTRSQFDAWLDRVGLTEWYNDRLGGNEDGV